MVVKSSAFAAVDRAEVPAVVSVVFGKVFLIEFFFVFRSPFRRVSRLAIIGGLFVLDEGGCFAGLLAIGPSKWLATSNREGLSYLFQGGSHGEVHDFTSARAYSISYSRLFARFRVV